MLKTRALAKRRRAVRNIWKITRTMGLIATARFRRAADQAAAAATYAGHLESILEHLRVAEVVNKSGLWRVPALPEAQRCLLVLTSNRGLCGGYNTAVVKVGLNYWHKHLGDLPPQRARLEISGKRGAGILRFTGIEPAEVYTQLSEKPRPEDVDILADRYWREYCDGKLASLDVVYTKLESLSRQFPIVARLLPPSEASVLADAQAMWSVPALFEVELLPQPRELVDTLLAEVFRARLHRAVFEAAAAEQIARMLAMRAATENAESMLSRLALMYHRARQTQITSELIELMSAAEVIRQ